MGFDVKWIINLAGCDGTESSRSYFTDLANDTPEAGGGKFGSNPFGKFGFLYMSSGEFYIYGMSIYI